MNDFYLEDKLRLMGQPKRTIGDYVESEGILVPTRFNSVLEAINSGRPIIFRSEHVQDYEGASGIVESPKLDWIKSDWKINVENEDQIKNYLFNPKKDDRRTYSLASHYCGLMNISLEDFVSKISFSSWEKIRGYSRTITSDSAIKGRYHIETWGENPENKLVANYSIFEQNELRNQVYSPLNREFEETVPRLVELYEQIRHLPRFDPNHCPIMEFVTSFEGENYFLQYHRTRDFEKSEFLLEREPTKNEKQTPFVRGATSPQGITVRATKVYGWQFLEGNKIRLKENEEASFDSHWNRVFSELMVRKRLIQFNSESDCRFKLMKYIAKHDPRSKLFKPKISLIDDFSNLVSKEDLELMYQQSVDSGEDQTITMYVISDGRKAYYQRVD